MTNIVLVEDHSLFRAGLVSIINTLPEMRVSAEYTDAEAFISSLNSLTREACDIILLDLALPGKSGIEILAELGSAKESLPRICILSMFPPAFYIAQAQELGAKGYLTKNCSTDQLSRAIKVIVNGGSFFPAWEETYVRPYLFSNLSEREMEVFKLLAKGLTIKEIAYELQISVKSVSTYKSRLMEKLGAHSLSDLYKIAVACQDSNC